MWLCAGYPGTSHFWYGFRWFLSPETGLFFVKPHIIHSLAETTSVAYWYSYLATRTRWRRVKTLGQHQVGVNLQIHAQHKLWISTWHIFHEFRKNNARLKLSYKFGESKWNPSWVIVLMSSSDSNYVANDHEDVYNVAHLQYHPGWCHAKAIL